MRVKKLLKVTSIVAVVLVAIGLLFVVAFIFNPFEGKVRDLRDAVPRSVDFFMRRLNLAADFVAFPEPHFWERFSKTVAWDKVRNGPSYRQMQRDSDIERVLGDMRDQIEAVARDTPLNLMRDVLGTEVQVAGTLRAPLATSTWCMYARVSWRVKVAFGLSGYGFVQDRARTQGIEIAADEDLLKITPKGSRQPLYAARHLDLVLVGNDRELLDKSLKLARGESTLDALGSSSDYRDGIENRLRGIEARTGYGTDALEVYLRPEKLFSITTWDDRWPDANHPESMNQRVLAAFVNLTGWRFASGALLFEPSRLGFIARVMLNQNEHTPFQSDFFRTEAQRRQEWLDPFLAMVPQDACALAAMRMPAGPFLRQMYRAMDPDWRTLFEDAIKRTGVYKSADELLQQLELAFLPRTGFVFRQNFPEKVAANGISITVADPTPLPQIAWVFWVRPTGGKAIVDRLVKAIYEHHRTIFGAPAYHYPLEGRADQILECTNPHIPGTGSLAFLFYDQFFILSNSSPLVNRMIAARDGRMGSILRREETRVSLEELPASINGFGLVQGPELEKLLVEMGEYARKAGEGMDPGWAEVNRPTVAAKVLKERYRQYGSQAGLPPEQKAKFDADVFAELQAQWAKQAGAYSAQDRAALEETIGLCRIFSAAYMQVVLDAQSIQLQGKAFFDWR